MKMPFTVIWTAESKECLRNFERNDAIRIIKKVEVAKFNPYYFAKKLVGKDEWRLRIGDFRVLIDINHEKEIIYVLRVGHRKNIYKW